MTSPLIQKAVSEMKKLKRGYGNGDGYLIDSGYNQGIDYAVEVLPQIITGVIEEIEKEAKEYVTKRMEEAWKPLKEVVKE